MQEIVNNVESMVAAFKAGDYETFLRKVSSVMNSAADLYGLIFRPSAALGAAAPSATSTAELDPAIASLKAFDSGSGEHAVRAVPGTWIMVVQSVLQILEMIRKNGN